MNNGETQIRDPSSLDKCLWSSVHFFVDIVKMMGVTVAILFVLLVVVGTLEIRVVPNMDVDHRGGMVYDNCEKICKVSQSLYDTVGNYGAGFFGWNKVAATAAIPRTNTKERLTYEDAQEKLLKFFKSLKQKYPSQSSDTWIKIYAAISSTMTQESPRQPSAIVLLTPPPPSSSSSSSPLDNSESPSKFSDCLARQIAQFTNSIFQQLLGFPPKKSEPLTLSENILSRMDRHDNDQLDAYEQITNYLATDKVVIVQNVDKINSEDHLFMFHALCDNSDAPVKRATYIFTVETPPSFLLDNLFDWTEENSAEICHHIFQSAWTSLTADKKPALIARVAATVVMLKVEPELDDDDCGSMDVD